jgi:outer membrane protein assembly factor BamE (lipoprotein component of BamABCDE complex)
MKKKLLALLSLTLVSASSCVSARNHVNDVHSTTERELTVGIVQKEIRQGMYQDQVAQALGSPNIVTKDENGQETWIFSKIATQASYSNSRAGGFGGLGAGVPVGASLLIGLGGGSYDESAGASATTQKNLTVVIKFTPKGTVQSATYHASTF